MTTKTYPRLPRRPADGMVVSDTDGNRWKYIASSDTWVNHGVIGESPVVTESVDGLVTPAVHKRLAVVRGATGNGLQLPPSLKINPHTDSYWYLFTSTDRLVKFTPEGPDKLRLEVNRQKLYAAVALSSCRGGRGDDGEDGDPGDDGPDQGMEPCYAPASVDRETLTFDIVVQAPLPSVDILLRIAPTPAADPVLSIAVSPSPPAVRLVSSTILFDANRSLPTIAYDVQTQRLTGTLYLTGGTWADLFPSAGESHCLLARQRGPTGDRGAPGRCVLEPQRCAAEYQDVKFTAPIVGLRRGCDGGRILTMSANLFQEACVSRLAFDPGGVGVDQLAPGPFAGSGVVGKLLAARKGLDSCKRFAVYQPDLKVPDRLALELPDWEPQEDCNVEKRAQLSDLNWVPMTAVAATAELWAGPDGGRSPQYPWDIHVPEASESGRCDPCAGGDGNALVAPPCPDNNPDSVPAFQGVLPTSRPRGLWYSGTLDEFYLDDSQHLGSDVLVGAATALPHYPPDLFVGDAVVECDGLALTKYVFGTLTYDNGRVLNVCLTYDAAALGGEGAWVLESQNLRLVLARSGVCGGGQLRVASPIKSGLSDPWPGSVDFAPGGAVLVFSGMAGDISKIVLYTR